MNYLHIQFLLKLGIGIVRDTYNIPDDTNPYYSPRLLIKFIIYNLFYINYSFLHIRLQ